MNGYRYYDRAQAEQARLVAWLRRIGMPLARIAEVVALDDGAAAAEIRAYRGRVEAETAARGELAAFLVDHLSAKENAGMSNGDGTGRGPAALGIRYAALTHPGAVRTSQQDTAYAGARLLAVADGSGASFAGRTCPASWPTSSPSDIASRRSRAQTGRGTETGSGGAMTATTWNETPVADPDRRGGAAQDGDRR